VLPRSRDLGTRQKMEKPVDAWTEKEKEKERKKEKHFREEVTSMVEH
jgi:hypothetical protein